MKYPLRIGIFGFYSSRNFGDTSIQMAVIDNLRRCFPDAELVGICPDPIDTERTHGIPAFPLFGQGWDRHTGCYHAPVEKAEQNGRLSITKRIFSKLTDVRQRLTWLYNVALYCRSIDLLLISGGGQLSDFWGGPWRFPFFLMIWSLFSRLNGAKVAVFGIGWDGLSTRLGKRFAFTALRLAHYRVFRDTGTTKRLVAEGLHLENRVCPDPAFGLSTPTVAVPNNRSKVIMVCPISAHAWLVQANASYNNYIEVLADTCGQWLREGYTVQLCTSQPAMDGPVAQYLVTQLCAISFHSDRIEVLDAKSVSEYLIFARAADIVVASRLHALILSAVAETPLVAISPGRKVSQLMTDLGLDDYCMELSALRAEPLHNAVSNVLINKTKLRGDLMKSLMIYRSELKIHYDIIAELL